MKKSIRQIIIEQKDESCYVPDPAFGDGLASKLKKTIASENSFSFFTLNKMFFLRKIPFFLSSIIIIVALSIILIFTNDIPKTSIVYAMERIEDTFDQLSKKDSIVHEKQTQTLYDESTGQESWKATYDLYSDQSSFMFRNIVKYEAVDVYQIHDKSDVYWNYSTDKNALEKEIYLNRSLDQWILGEKVYETLKVYQELIGSEDPRVFSETTSEIVIRQETESGYYLLYFNKESFLLNKKEEYKNIDGKNVLKSQLEVEILELIELNQENIDKLFIFDIELPENVSLIEKEYDFKAQQNTLEPSEYPAQQEYSEEVIPLLENKLFSKVSSERKFSNNKIDFTLPSDWTLTQVTASNVDEDSVYLIELEKGSVKFSLDLDPTLDASYIYNICGSSRVVSERVTLPGELDRVDEYLDLSKIDEDDEYKDSCQLFVKNHISNTSGMVWIGSYFVSDDNEYYPIYILKTFENETELYKVRFEYLFNENMLKFPIKGSDAMKAIQDDMSLVINLITFK